jgi:hypothetical protein
MFHESPKYFDLPLAVREPWFRNHYVIGGVSFYIFSRGWFDSLRNGRSMRLAIRVAFHMAAMETTLQGRRLLQRTGRLQALRRKLDWNSNGMYTAWLQGSS